MINPFTQYTLADQMPADVLCRCFSPELVSPKSLGEVTDPVSQYVLGTPGVGKTMILRMLTFKVQRELVTAEDGNSFLRSILGESKKYIGVYCNFDDDRIPIYGDGRLQEFEAIAALGDFIGTKLAIDMIDALSDPRILRIGGSTNLEVGLEKTAELAAAVLRKHIPDVWTGGWHALKAWFDKRETAHFRFASYNTDKPELSGYVPSTELPRSLMDAARRTGLLPNNCMLFIILDQADRILKIDSSKRVVSKIIIDATRLEVPHTYVKVGLRRRTHTEIKWFSNKLNLDREVALVELDLSKRGKDSKYVSFLADVCLKRLREANLLQSFGIVEGHSTKSQQQLISSLECLSPESEALETIKRHKIKDLHIVHFTEKWKQYGLSSFEISVLSTDVNSLASLVDQTILLMLISSRLRESIDGDISGQNGYKEDLDKLRQPLGRRLLLRVKHEEPATFVFIRLFGKRRKDYSGFSELAKSSERNVAHFLQTMGRLIRNDRDNFDKIKIPISASVQTDEVHYMSNDAWITMIEDAEFGVEISKLLLRLASELQMLMMYPWSVRTFLCGFILEADVHDLIRNSLDYSGQESGDGTRMVGLVLRDALDGGYLRMEEQEYGARYKFWINRIFLPLLGLPFQSQQEAPTISLAMLKKFFEEPLRPEEYLLIDLQRAMLEPSPKRQNSQMALLLE